MSSNINPISNWDKFGYRRWHKEAIVRELYHVNHRLDFVEKRLESANRGIEQLESISQKKSDRLLEAYVDNDKLELKIKELQAGK